MVISFKLKTGIQFFFEGIKLRLFFSLMPDLFKMAVNKIVTIN